MTGDEIAALGLVEVRDAIALGRLSSEEATAACLARIERYGEALNCVAHVDPDAALAAARDADRDLARNGPRGPLHGVPLAHKDMYYRAGRVSACGSRIRAGFVPEYTATALARLDAAGALDIGRLNMVEFALGVTGNNEITGDVLNPWNTDYTTGGSSSGPAASVAARLVYGALGSDTGGSIRVPAACCGLVGMKPTTGRVSRYGAMPLSFTLDCVGPLARTARDSALMLHVIAGHDENDPTSSESPVPDYLAGIGDGIKGLRIAVPETYFRDPVEDEIARLLDASLDVFRALGAEIVPVAVPRSIARANALTRMIIATEGAAYHHRWLSERPEDYGTQVRSRLLTGALVPATRYIEALTQRGRILAEFGEAVFARADVLHTPLLPKSVPTNDLPERHDPAAFAELVATLGHCTRLFNLMGLPAVSVPSGFTDDGLPAAFQLAGRPFDEARLYRAAHAYERETGWHARVPAL